MELLPTGARVITVREFQNQKKPAMNLLQNTKKKLMKENAELHDANEILKETFRFFVNDRKR